MDASAAERQGEGEEKEEGKEEEEEEAEDEREYSEDGHGHANVESCIFVSQAAAEKAHRGSIVNFWAQCDRCKKWRHLPESMQDEVDAAELWFCTMAPGITCDDLQDPAAEREHMVDDPNAENPGRRVEAKGSAAREGAQVRQRVEASLLEEMDMIDFGNEVDEEERQRNSAMDEGENQSEDEDEQDRDEDEQSRQRLAVAGEDDEDEERQDDDGSEEGVENNANTSAASGQKGHKRVSFASKASSDMSLCRDSSSEGSAAENLKNRPTDGLTAASTSEDHASPSGSCGDDGGDFDCGGGAEDGDEAQDAEQGGGDETDLGSFVAKNKIKSETCKKRTQVMGLGQAHASAWFS